jgi:hypothetical protein
MIERNRISETSNLNTCLLDENACDNDFLQEAPEAEPGFYEFAIFL